MFVLLNAKKAVAGVLGHVCRWCGCPGRWGWEVSPEERRRIKANGGTQTYLQVDHIKGQPKAERRMNQRTRWKRRVRDALAGLLAAACGPCNRKRGGGRRYRKVDKMRQGARRAKTG